MAPRAPNYQFERNERARAKRLKRAERLERRRADAEKRKAEREGVLGNAPADDAPPDTPSDG